jgi:hypothetical protein
MSMSALHGFERFEQSRLFPGVEMEAVQDCPEARHLRRDQEAEPGPGIQGLI